MPAQTEATTAPIATTFPVRFYDARTTGLGESFPAGFYADHRDPAVRAEAFRLRNETDATYYDIAELLGLQCWQHAKMAAEAQARRIGSSAHRSYRRSTRQVVNHLLVRRFGIEIEFNQGEMHYRGDTGAVAAAMTRAGLNAEAESYNHSTRPHWKVTTDATVTGCEVVSPILRGADWDEVDTTMRSIRGVGGTVGANCGMHVHHDATDFDSDAMGDLLHNLQMTQHAIAAYVTRSRYNGRNSYGANLLSDYEWRLLTAAHSDGRMFAADQGRRSPASGFSCPVGRYKFFNFQPLGMYGTVEFRGHGGTLNARKARAWVAIGQAVMEYSRQGFRFDQVQSPASMVDVLVEAGLLTEDMAARFIRRVVALRGEAQAHTAGRLLD